MPVRLYDREPFLVSFEARVADIREVSRSHIQTLWQIALDRTAFYPASGGQPHDTGTLQATAPSGAMLRAPVLMVDEDAVGEIWHTTSKPLLAGTAVAGNVDWIRRRDHMQQHSGQHLLSAIFFREIAAPTVSFHLGESASTIDLAAEALSPEALERVENAANEAIAEDLPVRIKTIPRIEAEALLARGGLRKLPPREGAIRLIEIEGLDLNACGGTHVRSTGQIGSLLIRGTERVSGGMRVEFECGLRAARVASRDFSTLSRAARALSAHRLQLPEAVNRLLGENKALQKDQRRLWGELARYDALRLGAEEPVESGLRIVRRDLADRDREYIKLLASRLTTSLPRTCALLASNRQEPATIVLGASGDLDLDCAAVLGDALGEFGARGGGSRGLAQGEVPGNHVEALLTAVEAALRARRQPNTGAQKSSKKL